MQKSKFTKIDKVRSERKREENIEDYTLSEIPRILQISKNKVLRNRNFCKS